MVRLSHEDSGSSGRFVIYDDDIFAGEMTYTRRNDGNIVIDHTGVESAFGGKGSLFLSKRLALSCYFRPLLRGRIGGKT